MVNTQRCVSIGLWQMALVLTVACTGVYAGKLGGPLLFDDDQAIVDNTSIRNFDFGVLSPPRETPVAGRPLPNLSFALDYALHGLAPFGFHLVNLGLHALVALLLFALLRELFATPAFAAELRPRASWLAASSALLFCVHPLCVELVLYASQRTESLVAACYLGAMLTLALAARSERASRFYPQMLALSFMGALSKEVFVTAPVVGVFFDRAFYAGSFAEVWRKRAGLHACLAACWLPIAWIAHLDPRPGSVRFAELSYVVAQAKIIPDYFAQAVWPAHPALDYGPLLSQNAAESWPWLLVLGVCVLVACVLAFMRPRVGFVGVWIFGILAPSSSIFSIHTEVGAERRFYLPLAGLIAVLVYAVAWLATRGATERLRVLGLLLAASVCGLVIASRSQAAHYASVRQAWQSAIAARPENPRAHYNLAETLRREGDERAAIAALREALRIWPDYADAQLNLGGLLLARGEVEEALVHLARGVELRPDDAQAHFNYGLGLGMSQQFRAAAQELQRSLQLAPEQPRARLSLASALLQLQRLDAAREQVDWLLARAPNDPRAQALRERIDAARGQQ